MKVRPTILFALLSMAVLVLFTVDMMTGTVQMSCADVWRAVIGRGDATTVKIVQHIRLIKAVVALLVGAGLSVSGLQMQTLFRNPLAGPYVLGITSGASLGVAMFLLGAPLLSLSGEWVSSVGVVGAAWIGSAIVLVVIGILGSRIKDIMVILILGMMFSSGVGALVQVLQYLSHEDALKSFVVWTMGALGDVTATQMWIFVPTVVAGLILAVLVIKPLNLLLRGEQYAATMGVNLRKSRGLIFLSTTLLAGTVTAFCGPIGFVGLAVPHVTRYVFGSADNRVLVPGSVLIGMAMMLVCDMLSKQFLLPINSTTALMGIPIVVWIVLKNKDMMS